MFPAAALLFLAVAASADIEECPAADRGCAAREILARFELDQSLRGRLEQCFALAGEEQGRCMSRSGAAMLEQDRLNTAALKRTVARHGWPFAGWGPRAAEAAWHLVQHAVDSSGEKDVAFQREALPHVSAAVAAGELTPWHYAALNDRIRMRLGARQLYGTQTTCKEGAAAPLEMEAPEQVDLRRRAIGLPPLAQALAEKTPDCAR